jgi:hypothetical protein
MDQTLKRAGGADSICYCLGGSAVIAGLAPNPHSLMLRDQKNLRNPRNLWRLILRHLAAFSALSA